MAMWQNILSMCQKTFRRHQHDILKNIRLGPFVHVHVPTVHVHMFTRQGFVGFLFCLQEHQKFNCCYHFIVFAFYHAHDCIVTSHLRFMVLKQVFSMVIFFWFFGCCCYAHHAHGCITPIVCIKQLFIVLTFCFDGFLVISFCLHFVVVTLYLHFATPKYFFQVSKFYFYFLL